MDKAQFRTFVFFFLMKLGSLSRKGHSNSSVYWPLQCHSYRAHFKVYHQCKLFLHWLLFIAAQWNLVLTKFYIPSLPSHMSLVTFFDDNSSKSQYQLQDG